MNQPFEYTRRVAFSDTDAMGVAHHASYLRFCEEARVAWMRERELTQCHFPKSDHVLAVLHSQLWHFRPCTFEDLLRIQLQVRLEGLKIHFQYAIYKDAERIAQGETLHITLNKDLKVVRPNRALLQALEKEPWTETWLSNL